MPIDGITDLTITLYGLFMSVNLSGNMTVSAFNEIPCAASVEDAYCTRTGDNRHSV